MPNVPFAQNGPFTLQLMRKGCYSVDRCWLLFTALHFQIFKPYERLFSLVYLRKRMFGGGRPLLLEILGQRSHSDPKFLVEGVAPTNYFCTDSWANKCLTTLLPTVFTESNFVADFLQAMCDFRRKSAILRLRGSRATYDDQLRLIRKRVWDFLLALIELFH